MMNEPTNDNDILENLFQIVVTVSEKIDMLEENLKIFTEQELNNQALKIQHHFELNLEVFLMKSHVMFNEFSKKKLKEKDFQEIKNMIQEEFKILKEDLKTQQNKSLEKESPENTLINIETLEL